MSFVHVDIAIGSTRYKGVMKAVTIALCRHLNAKRIEANDDYEVWAGLKTLCKETGWKRTSVQTAIDKLAKDKNPFLEIKSQGVGKTPLIMFSIQTDWWCARRYRVVRKTVYVYRETVHGWCARHTQTEKLKAVKNSQRSLQSSWTSAAKLRKTKPRR